MPTEKSWVLLGSYIHLCFELSSSAKLKNFPSSPKHPGKHMNTQSKPITVKSFLFKAGTKAANSASGFLQAYREFLVHGEVASITSPILARVDAKELLPTPALELIRQAVLSHHLLVEAKKAEDKLLAEQNPSEKKPTSNYTASIYTSKGEEVLSKNFTLPQDGGRWIDRTLFASESDYYGVLQSNHILIKGELQSEVYLRQDSIARLLRPSKHPFSKKTGSNGKLSWGVKLKPSHASFSRG
jgi:hypothetical protein